MFETYNVQGMIVGYKGQPQGQAQSRLETYIMQGMMVGYNGHPRAHDPEHV